MAVGGETMKMGGRFLLCAGLGAMVAGAPAQAACWTEGQAAAARIREFQTMLMVVTLRCRAAGIDISQTYNGFVAARRTAIELANADIQRHFAGAGGEQAQYDGFATTLANRYGANETTPALCAETAQLALDASDDAADLQRISERSLAMSVFADACSAPRLAAALPAAPPPPVDRRTLADAAPKAAAAPAGDALPPEVVSAMAVITAYARDHAAATAPIATAMAQSPTAR